MADPESSIGDRPGRSGVSWLLVVFFLVFVAIVLVLGRGPDESRRRERVPPRPGSEPGKIDSSRLSGTSNVASPSVSLRRLVARGSVLDEITAAPVRGARVVLSLRAPLGKSRDPRATLVLSRGCLPASGPERETSKDGLDLPVLGVAESGEDGSFAISLAWPAEDLAALVWALRRDENRFSVSARFAAGSRHLAGHRAIEADRWTAEGVLDAGAIVVREPLGRLTV
ncbi:hypothetical protein HY251_13680, partial [bacterium]|nr:hypothetical protein [bacterium]